MSTTQRAGLFLLVAFSIVAGAAWQGHGEAASGAEAGVQVGQARPRGIAEAWGRRMGTGGVGSRPTQRADPLLKTPQAVAPPANLAGFRARGRVQGMSSQRLA